LATGDEKNKTIAVVAYPRVALLDLVLGAISAVRTGLSLAAPVIAAKPKRMIGQYR
jgi:hypothetical protein